MNSNQEKLIIAIDGHSSCGKSTVAKALAKKLNYTYIDTGAMYRCVTLFVIKKGLANGDIINEEELKKHINTLNIEFKNNEDVHTNDTYLNGNNVEHEIRTLEVSNLVSPVSKIKFVREQLVALQRKMGEKKGIVMDGRDIGTVVFPNADLKIFMTAEPKIRAERRYKELQEKGENVTFEEILKNVEERDRIDSTRKESPLKKADDAIVLDNSNMNKEQQLIWIIKTVEKTIG